MEALMRTFYFAAALLTASTAAHAGNGISFQINGQKVHIEAPRNCEALSCVQITTPGMSGNLKSFTSKLGGDDDNSTTDSNPPAQKTAPDAPAPAPAPQAQEPQIKAP